MTTADTRLGLALGSGAARGLAHVGVLRAFAEAGLSPGAVAGTSIGAIVGGVYAAGRLDEFAEFVLGLDWRRSARLFLEASFPHSGLIEGVRICELLRRIVGRRGIEELPIAFRAVATDVETGREVVIGEGDLVAAIRASIAVPGIFSPARRRSALLVDGGLVNPVPISVCRALGAQRVVAVDVNHGWIGGRRRAAAAGGKDGSAPPPGAGARRLFQWLERRAKRRDAGAPAPAREWTERRRGPSIFEVLGHTLRIVERQITEMRLRLDRPDRLIRPRVGHYQFLDFHRARELIEEGYRAAKEALAAAPANESDSAVPSAE